MNDYKIAIIGNSPVSEIVSLLLGNNFEVTCYKDTVETAVCYPYFANDLNEGILKKFIEKTNISLHERNLPDIEIKYDKCATFVCQPTFENFSNTLKSEFCEHFKKIEIFLNDVEKIGKEWKDFIENDFDSNKTRMIYSAKFFDKTLEKYFKKIGLKSQPIFQICQTILPVLDVSFSVFSGYLYTQFFDNHILKEQLWKEIKLQSLARIKEIKVDKLPNLRFEKTTINEPSKEKFNCIIDLREDGANNNFFNKTNDNVSQFAILGTICLKNQVLEKNRLYCFKDINRSSLRIWSNFESCNTEFQFELYINGDNLDFNNSLNYNDFVLNTIRNYLGDSEITDIDIIYNHKQIKKMFDTNKGYMWAFSTKQSLLDPTYAFFQKKESVFTINYWGFAWFSAAFNIYNILLNKTDFSNQYYIYDGGNM